MKNSISINMKLTVFGLLFLTILSCKQTNRIDVHKRVETQTNIIFDSLIEIRRDLHKYPELSGDEKRTSKIIATYLTNLGLEVKTGVGGYGVVGILKGDEKGRKIAWRADMDAIRSDAKDYVDFESQNIGIRHLCGHEVHTTIGLGIATVLARQKETLGGTVYFIFQPSEETFVGAKNMIKDGLFDLIEPEEIFGLHIGPAEKGIISAKANELFAYKNSIQIKFKPETNDIEIKNYLNNLLQNFVRIKANSTPWSLDFLTDVKQGIESEESIYKDYFIIESSHTNKNDKYFSFETNFLETDKERIDSIPLKIKEQIINSKFKDLFLSIKFSKVPTVMNDPKLTAIAMKILDSLSDNKLVKPMYGQIPYFNEDFIYFQEKVPGVLFLIGGSNIEKGINSMPHSPNFVVDEEAIKIGVQYFSSLLLERTKR